MLIKRFMKFMRKKEKGDILKKALVSLSFDDGRDDNWDIINNITIPKNIPVTVNVTTGYIDKTCPLNLLPTSKDAITVDNVKEFWNSPLVELALHGDYHLNTEEDLKNGKHKLEQWLNLPLDSKFGFASPGSGMDVDEFKTSDSVFLQNEILYMRTSLRIHSYTQFRVFCRKVGRIIHLPVFYKIAYKDTLMSQCDDRIIYSVPVLKDITFNQVKGLIELCIRRKMSITLMFHSILQDTVKEDNWTWDREKFIKLCDYLKKREREGKIEVCTTNKLYEQIKV